MTRYVIIGTGAVGGTIGGRLAQHDVPVVWVARGEHARVLTAEGMTLRTPEGSFNVTAPVWTGPVDADLRLGDVLVLGTKVHQAIDALAAWADVPVRAADSDGVVGTAGAVLPLITATNGLAGEDIAIRYFRRVYGAAVWCPATHIKPGEIIPMYDSVSGVFWLGAYPGPSEPDALVRSISADWESARLGAPVTVDVMAWKRRKLVMNMGNAVDALVDPSDAGGKRLLKSAMQEAEAALQASGASVISPERDAEERAKGPQIAKVEGAPEQIGSSTFQSLTRGTGTVETDYLNGEIVRLGALYGVPTPVNAALASLARRAAANGWAPRSLAASAVDDEIAGS
ncbi:MAG: ketopantoate reductase family protein [Cumulibacter sp.]